MLPYCDGLLSMRKISKLAVRFLISPYAFLTFGKVAPSMASISGA